jgi:hypothetical protein
VFLLSVFLLSVLLWHTPLFAERDQIDAHKFTCVRVEHDTHRHRTFIAEQSHRTAARSISAKRLADAARSPRRCGCKMPSRALDLQSWRRNGFNNVTVPSNQ